MPTTAAAATGGPVMTAAASVSTVVTSATRISGTAKRTVRDSASMSPVVRAIRSPVPARSTVDSGNLSTRRSEEHTSELQSRENLVCRLLLEKKKENGREYNRT